MAQGESYWIDRAQTAEASLQTCRDNQDRVKEKLRSMMESLGVRERSDGTIDIDFEALADKLSLEHALVLREEIDKRHKISGEAGEKPKVKVAAGQTA